MSVCVSDFLQKLQKVTYTESVFIAALHKHIQSAKKKSIAWRAWQQGERTLREKNEKNEKRK